MATTQSSVENATDDRSIESDRLRKALTQPMAIERVAPRQYDVTHDGTTRTVDTEAGSCSCADYEYRGERFVCKHVLAAAIHAVFTEGVRTRLQARVVAATREAGCPHAHGSITDEHDCEGPLGRGAFPCPDCVRCSPGEWSAWVALVGGGPDASATVDRGEGVCTDGGVVQERPSDENDENDGAAQFDVSDADTVVIDQIENEQKTFVIEDEPAEAWSFALVDGEIVFVNDHYKEGLAELERDRLDKETVAWDDFDGQRARLLEADR